MAINCDGFFHFAPDNTQYDMTHSIISLGKGFTLDPCKELVSPVGSVGASKGRGLLRSPQATRTPLHSCSGQAVLNGQLVRLFQWAILTH